MGGGGLGDFVQRHFFRVSWMCGGVSTITDVDKARQKVEKTDGRD